MTDRVVALIDMDCFYCQVEERLNPELKGKPAVVVQYNPWKGGGILAVNYEARAQGVKRGMRGDQAKQLCPDVELCAVPMFREKADLTRYRDASREVFDVMCKLSTCVQRASIDEAYLDLTQEVETRLPNFINTMDASNIPNTFVIGYTPDSTNEEVERNEGTNRWLKDLYLSGLNDVDTKKLAVGAIIVEEIRKAILETVGFKCSAGIAHNKILAKLAAGIHKPNRQTILPHASVAHLYTSLPVRKIRNLGGKLGRHLEDHNVNVMADLLKFSQSDLIKLSDERMGNWLYQIARGHDNEPVQARLISKSIACCKNFPGKMSLSQGKEVELWLNKLTEELLERLLEDETLNSRKAQHIVFSVRLQKDRREIATSKSLPLNGYSHDKIVNSVRNCLKKLSYQDPITKVWSPIITFLGLSAGKFAGTSNKLMELFAAMKDNRPKIENPEKMVPSSSDDYLNEPPTSKSTLCESTKNVEEGATSRTTSTSERTSHDLGISNCTPPVADVTLSECTLDESAGPSFFEKMLLDSVVSNGKRVKLNLMPTITQPSPRKALETYNPVDKDSPRKPIEADTSKNHSSGDSHGSESSVSGGGIRHEENSKSCKTGGDISYFFGKKQQTWVNPLEIFPDIEEIDESILALFPVSYQKKILELRKSRGNESSRDSEVNSDKVKDNRCIGSASNVDFDKADASNTAIHGSQQPSTSDCVMRNELPLYNTTNNQLPESAKTCHEIPSNFNEDSIPSPAENRSCPECQIFLAVKDFDEHMDFHCALRLQEEINQPPPRPVPVTTKTSASKRKNKVGASKLPEAKKMKSIEAFFKKSS